MVTFGDLIKTASSKEMRKILLEVYERMTPSIHLPLADYRRLAALEQTDYVSFRTLLGAYAQLASPRTYLEIGTRRGHSACMMARCSPKTEIFCFDMFMPGYAGEDNPGQRHVEAELQKFGASATFFVGNSRATIPNFFQNKGHPQEIDVILVDGDHSWQGALADLQNVVAHVAVGGLLVFDDIAGKFGVDPLLDKTWVDFISAQSDFSHLEDRRHENGWGVAIRRASPSQKTGERR